MFETPQLLWYSLGAGHVSRSVNGVPDVHKQDGTVGALCFPIAGNHECLVQPRTNRRENFLQLERYEIGELFDEIFVEQGQARASSRKLVENIENLAESELINRQRAVEHGML